MDVSIQLLFAGGGTLADPVMDSSVIWLIRKSYFVGKLREKQLQHDRGCGYGVTAARKLMEAGAVTMAAAAYVYFAFIPPKSELMTLPSSSTVPTQAEAPDPIAAELAQVADQMNR